MWAFVICPEKNKTKLTYSVLCNRPYSPYCVVSQWADNWENLPVQEIMVKFVYSIQQKMTNDEHYILKTVMVNYG